MGSGAQDTTDYCTSDDQEKNGQTELDPRAKTLLFGRRGIVSRLIVVWLGGSVRRVWICSRLILNIGERHLSRIVRTAVGHCLDRTSRVNERLCRL